MMLGFALLAGAVLLSGCASLTGGKGSVIATGSRTPTGSAPATSLPPTSIAPPSTSVPSSSAAPQSCGRGIDYCDDFASAASGWPVENKTDYYAHYDPYGGGTYRMGERTGKAKTELAPVDTTTISKDYGVQVEVNAVLGKNAPSTSYLGLVCWDHDSAKHTEAGFLFFVTAASVDVTLLPDTGSQPRTLDVNQSGNFVKPFPATNHLSATCEQRRSAGRLDADLVLSVNGSRVLHVQYAKSVKNYAWSPGPHVGLLVGGPKSDVYYDNFSVAGR